MKYTSALIAQKMIAIETRLPVFESLSQILLSRLVFFVLRPAKKVDLDSRNRQEIKSAAKTVGINLLPALRDCRAPPVPPLRVQH